LTDTQQQKQIDEAAEKFAGAVKESYQTVADRAVSAQELNAQLTENFFNRVINNLHTQADQNREMTQKLADQQQRGVEAAQQLTQESVGAYMDFLNSTFSFAQDGIQAEKRGAEELAGTAGAEGGGVQPEGRDAQEAVSVATTGDGGTSDGRRGRRRGGQGGGEQGGDQS
jgi:threonine synthase